jgi:hypothetical protein
VLACTYRCGYWVLFKHFDIGSDLFFSGLIFLLFLFFFQQREIGKLTSLFSGVKWRHESLESDNYLAQVGTHHIIVVMATYHDCSLPEIHL